MDRAFVLFAMSLVSMVLSAAPGVAQDRETKVRNDRKTVEGDGYWIYNDLAKGFAEAKASGKPLFVVIRCIPCEACAQLDAQVVQRHPVVQELLKQFVCVRIVQANGLDLSLFQYDYDQSLAAFFLNTDQTIYGRYGTRTHQTESEKDVSVEGLARALEGALALHREYPGNAKQLAGKRGPEVQTKVPEEFPSLAGRYGPKLNYEGNVVRSCIHCHQVGEALRLESRTRGEQIPEHVLYPYPMPNLLGITLDPKEKARILEVTSGSSAERDGFQKGDDLVTLAGQPLLSIADVQWVLHRAGNAEQLKATVQREGKMLDRTLTLPAGWRRRGDISWRAGSWDLRRMTTGGLVLESLPDTDRKAVGLSEKELALRVRHVGQYNEHAAAKNAGFQKGDLLVELDGESAPLTESELMTWLLTTRRKGDRIPVVVLRAGQRVKLMLPIQ